MKEDEEKIGESVGGTRLRGSVINRFIHCCVPCRVLLTGFCNGY